MNTIKKRLIALAALLMPLVAIADNSPVIWKGSNAKDLSSGGLETNKVLLPKAAGSSVKTTVQASGSTGSSYTLTLPTGVGNASEVLKTDGAGVTAWTKIADANVATSAAIDATKIGGGAVSNTEFGYLDGVTSALQTQLDGKQPLDSDLTAVAGLSSTGVIVRTGSGTATTRSVAGGTGISVSNGDGVSGNPTVAIDSTVATLTGSQILTNKTVDAASNTLSNISNTEIKSGAAIARNKLASGTASHVLINDGSGVMSSEAQLDKTRGGTGVSSTATFPSSGVVVTEAASEALTNKDVSSSTNTYRAATTGTIGAVKLNTVTTKKLATPISSDATMTDLSFTVTNGATYQVILQFDINTTSTDRTCGILIKENGNTIGRVIATTGGSVAEEYAMSWMGYVTTTGTTITFASSGTSANCTIAGDGTFSATWAQVVLMNNI